MAALSEGIARTLFRQSSTSTISCLVVNDRTTGVRGIPNSFCQMKPFESALVDYRFNDCGYRTPQPCRPAPDGTYRIVMLGSSVGYGMMVNQPDSFAARLGPMLSKHLNRPVDVFNESMQWGMPASVALRTDDMLKPHPNMVLWALTPFDIENVGLILPYVQGVQMAYSIPIHGATAPTATPPRKSLRTLPTRAWKRILGPIADSRTVFMIQHYLYRSDSQYLSHTLTQADSIDYLRSPPSPELRANLATFASAFHVVAARAHAAGVPVVVTLVPSRAQAIMLSSGTWDKGYDPNQLARLLRPIVEAEGGRYVDMTAELRRFPNAGQLYFSVDEHLPPKGNQMLATLLSNALLKSGTIGSGLVTAR